MPLIDSDNSVVDPEKISSKNIFVLPVIPTGRLHHHYLVSHHH